MVVGSFIDGSQFIYIYIYDEQIFDRKRKRQLCMPSTRSSDKNAT